MVLTRKISLLTAGYIFLSAAAYLLLFNKNSWKDEFFLTGAFLFFVVLYLSVAKPLLRSSRQLTGLFKHHESTEDNSQDEIQKLKKLIEHYIANEKQAVELINVIREGKAPDFDQVKSGSALMLALRALHGHIATMFEKEKERTWVSQGLANFGTTLRNISNDPEKLYHQLISELVKYLGATQGGLFLVNEEKTKLELKGCYAYERKKFLQKEIEVGQGLTGQVYLEKETLLLRQIPQNYLNITSGLGNAEPSYLLIVPFKINDEVECLVELASFNPFGAAHIEFIEKLGEIVAVTILNIRTANQTKKLLHETQQSAEQMRAQEEELKQNMEEMEATQEEMRRKEKEMIHMVERMTESEKKLKDNLEEIKSLKENDEAKTEQMMKTIEEHRKMLIQIIDQVPQKIFLKDKEGKFILANSAVAKAHHKTVDELLGTSDFDHFSFEDATQYRMAELEIIKKGKPVYFPEEIFKDSNGEDRILQTTKIPFHISHLNQVGLLGIQTDVTEMKRMEMKLKQVQG